MTATDQAVLRLAQCRKAAKVARAEWHRIAAEAGKCTKAEARSGYGGGPCYDEHGLPDAHWCASCRQREAPWKAYRKASSEAAGALRSVLALGRRLLTAAPSASHPLPVSAEPR
jgi:hypothetical protein